LRGCDEPSPTDYPGVVAGAEDLRFHTDLLDVLAQRVMVGDGAMGNGILDGMHPRVIETKYVRLQSG
jgi:hypothetical protein